jgi:multiple sugar transport system substrate-binding protein
LWDEQYKETGYPCTVNMTDETAILCLQGQVDLMYDYQVSPPPTEADAMTAAGDPFLTGRVAMNYTGGWQFGQLMGFDKFRWGVGAIPYKESNVVSLFPDGNVIARTTKHPDEAWRLTMYISTGEGLEGFVMEGGDWPCADLSLEPYAERFSSMVDPAEFQQVWMGGIDAAIIPGSHDMADWARFSQRLNSHLSALWLGDKSVEDTARDAEAELQALVDENCGNSIEQDVEKYFGTS